MEKPNGMSEVEFQRKILRGEFDKGHDKSDPTRGPDHPDSIDAREARAHFGGDESKVATYLQQRDMHRDTPQAPHGALDAIPPKV